MSETDAMVRRMLSLAVEFSNAAVPLTSAHVHEAYYGGLSRTTFNTQFRRDRERLALCGLAIREAGPELWEADHSSFASEIDADPEDLRALDLTCLQLAEDDAFPYREELRYALAKMDRAFSGTAMAAGDPRPSQGPKVLTLLAARAARHAVQVRYVDARGNDTRRTLAILGEFGLRGHVYFVACDLGGTVNAENPSGKAGQLGVPHVFRDDRFRTVKELSSTSYKVPADFRIEDWRRLPFQLGEQSFEAELVVPTDPSDAAREALTQDGSCEPTANGRTHWYVTAADATALARWAIAESFVPVAPPELVDAWRTVLMEVAR